MENDIRTPEESALCQTCADLNIELYRLRIQNNSLRDEVNDLRNENARLTAEIEQLKATAEAQEGK